MSHLRKFFFLLLHTQTVNRFGWLHRIVNLCVLLLLNIFLQFLLAQSIRIDSVGYIPSMNSDGQGGAYVLWSHQGKAIYLKHFDSTGQSITTDSTSFTDTEYSNEPRMALGATHNVVVWSDLRSAPAYNTYIGGAIFAKNDMQRKVYFRPQDLRFDALRGSPDVRFLNDTTFLVIWHESIIGTLLWGQFYSIAGQKIGENFILIDTAKGVTPGLSRLLFQKGSNSFIVISRCDSSGVQLLQSYIFDLSGKQLGSAFRITENNTTHHIDYAVAEEPEGNFLVAWTITWNKISRNEWRWFSKDGTPMSEVQPLTLLDTVVNYSYMSATIDEKGRAVLVWLQQTANSPFRAKIFGRCYASGSHAPMGEIFQISTDTLSHIDIDPRVAANNGFIFATWITTPDGISGRILKFSEVTAVEGNGSGSGTLPVSFHLYQNFPNPFNPSTTIRYGLKEHSDVRLDIYNVPGQVVTQLHLGLKNAGIHNLTVDMSRYSSGIYFYRIDAAGAAGGKFISISKMLLVK
jgi:hypothetical protein